MSDLIAPLLNWISQNPIGSGWVIFLVAMLESLAIIGLLVPGALMMVGFGALIASDTLAFWPTVGWAAAGAVVGDGISFLLGCHFTERTATLWPFSRHPKLLKHGVIFFQRHGTASVALGRFIGPIRAVIPLIAGMMGMSPKRFLLANLLSALLWAPIYLLPGIALGSAFDQATDATVRLITLGLLLLTVGWSLLWLLKRLLPIAMAKAAFSLLLALIVISGAFLYWQPGYALKQEPITLQQAHWWQQHGQQLPHRRHTPCQAEQTAFNIQFTGDLQQLSEALQQQGWHVSERLSWMNILKLFSPDLTPDKLPVISTRHGHHIESLIVQRKLADGRQLLLRLWPSQFQLADHPIWLGRLSQQHRLEVLDLLFLPISSTADPALLVPSLPWSNQQQQSGKLLLIDATQQP
ncbi:MAG: VTT domain-containing protein [Candidatus Polarisedimenticolaceae bacterium]|nr:VTT domain-containing protein [Candidatus Polarisedimenticolaceae bacterium]